MGDNPRWVDPAPAPPIVNVRQALGVAVGGLAYTLALVFPRFSDVWQSVSPQDGDGIGEAWEKAIESVPEAARPAGLIKTIERLPWVNAIARTAVVFFPRFTYTLKYLRRPRPEEQQNPGWRPNAPAAPPAAAPAATNGTVHGPTQPPQPVEDESRIPSAYDDQSGVDLSAIDGSESRAAET